MIRPRFQHITILLYICSLSLFTYAGEVDSLNVINFDISGVDQGQLDTSIRDFQYYTHRLTIGNPGMATNEILLHKDLQNQGFTFAPNYLKPYQYFLSDKLFWQTHRPYTNLGLYIGQKKEQTFRLLHTQNVNSNWNIAVAFNRMRLGGWYLRQNVNHNNGYISSNFKSRKGKYELYFVMLGNKQQLAENGGISNDSLFENTSLTDKQLIPVNLSAAQRIQGENTLSAQQHFLFRRSFDSTTMVFKGLGLYLSNQLKFGTWSYQDQNINDDFYLTTLNDTLQTNDSTRYKVFNNEAGFLWRLKQNEKKLQLVKAGLLYQHFNVRNVTYATDSINYNIALNAELINWRVDSSFNAALSGNYNLSGANKGDLTTSLHLLSALDSSIGVFANLSYQNVTPYFMAGSYKGNHYDWQNSFGKTTTFVSEVGAYHKKLRLELKAGITSYDQPIYFDEVGIVRQFDGALSLFDISLKHHLVVKNWLHFKNQLTYQVIPDSSVIRLPEFVSSHSLYIEKSAFKNALRFQFGFDLFYYTSYYANAYMPVTGQFMIQNEYQVGSYPLADVFLNLLIKNARLFVKAEHFNSGLSDKPYYALPHYPYTDRAIKIGINWHLAD